MDLRKLTDTILAKAPVRPTARTREWFRVRNAAKPGPVVDIDIYSEIGAVFDGLTAADFVSALAQLPANTETIRVHVNCLGGEVFDAIAIANALQQHPARIEMLIEGVAASSATIITQGAGDVVKIADNALVMIHDPFALTGGTAQDLRLTAEMLDEVKAVIVATYQRASKLPAEQLAAMMAETTWMDAEEAIANGFATEVVSAADETKAVAAVTAIVLAAMSVPEKYKPAFAAAIAPPKNDLKIASGPNGTSMEEFCQAVCEALKAVLGDPYVPGVPCWFIVQTYEDAVVVNRDGETWEYPITAAEDGDEIALGAPFEVEMVWVPAPDAAGAAVAAALTTKARAKSKAIALRPTPPPAPSTVVPADAAEVLELCAVAKLDIAFARGLIASKLPTAAAIERIAQAGSIRALCEREKLPELAEGYIAGAMPLEHVKAHLVTVTAKLDRVQIDAKLGPEDGNPRHQPAIDVRAVYAERNKPRA